MHTLDLPKSVLSFERGPLRHLALSELAYLIKKKPCFQFFAPPPTTAVAGQHESSYTSSAF